MIFKIARDRTEDGREVKRGAVVKDNNGRFVTERKCWGYRRQTARSC